MSVRRVKNHGKWVYQARVAFKGLRKAAFRATKDEARTAESELLQELKEKASAAAADQQAPATLRQLFEAYAEDLADRGKADNTIERSSQTARVIERLRPELLKRPVSTIGAEIFALRKLRRETSIPALDLRDQAAKLREAGKAEKAEAFEKRAKELERAGTKTTTINRDMRTLRSMLKQARPDCRFPAAAFASENETRVRWLRPEEELLVLETMRSPFREIAKLAALRSCASQIRCLRRPHGAGGVILLPRAKAGARPVVLSDAVQKILRGQLEAKGTDEWVSRARPAGPTNALRRARVPPSGPGRRPPRLPLPRPATPRRDHGSQQGIHGADRHGPWWLEDRAHDAALRAVTDATLRAAAEAVSGAESGSGFRQPASMSR